MPDSYYLPLDDDGAADGVARYRATPATAGPWSPQLQHGGPPNALAVRTAELLVRAGSDIAMTPLRVAADFVGPVPVGDVEVGATVLRAARSAALVEAVVRAGGRDCVRARVWFVRAGDTAGIAAAQTGAPLAPAPLPGPADAVAADGEMQVFGYGESVEWRFVSGAVRTPGPAVVWARPRLDLLPGEPATGLARVVLVADSASGVSAQLDWSRWSFVNVDLDVHLARPVTGDWVLLDAATQLGPSGSALARATIADLDGVAGAGLQTLVVAPLRR